MFERFTDRARRVIVVAQDTAREMSHPQISPEHLLLALGQGEGVAAMAMTQSGVDTARLRQRVADNLEHRPGAQKLDKIPFSPEAKKALELSLRQALALGHNYIGTEHLFLGLEREAEQRGQTLDGLLGVKSAEVHAACAGDARRSHRLATRALPRTSVRPGSSPPQAQQTPMTTGHVLAAIVGDRQSQATQALSALGVTEEAVQAALVEVSLAGTSDATSPAQSVAITIGETTTTISDPAVAGALQDLSADQLRDAIKKTLGLGDGEQATG